MAVYDLEEQEKLDDLKAFWRRWGNAISTIIVAISLVFVGVQAWRWYQDKRAADAAVLYGAVAQGVRSNDVPKARDAMAQLADSYKRTGYAPRAALLYAKLAWDQGDRAGAKAQLQWVLDNAAEDELKQVARYRLAQALLGEKQVEQALATLDAKHAEPFAGLYADLRGDALSVAGRVGEAKAAYQLALSKLDQKSPYRNYVQLKLDALPGDAAAAVAGSVKPASTKEPPK
ncbi:MAG TPA: tetratricopeptide repeat protein [Casimicrobiaceae bacterium]|nr:tetratricopeptide repeat protein [Casimicrobiaceae bacterium]